MSELALLEISRMRGELRHSEYVDTMYKTGTIIGLGVTFYVGWFAYQFFTNSSISLRNAVGEVVETNFPPVNPYLGTPVAVEDYWDAMKVNGVNQHDMEWNINAFKDAQRFIQPDGSFTGYTTSYYMAKEAEAALVKAGKLRTADVAPMHPVDVVANFVLNNKWYWGATLGLAAVPMLFLGIKTLKGFDDDAMQDS